ncbi:MULTISPECIES: helix-turn-helix domain-containing protein [unclassified Romboutsia]|uniref:helix-turn-helix domain-containing protein n=1 Tax=unclassified Romboutsia TaxID=2626894 RepID=UPI000820EAC3|nr:MULTISPECIES: helix-turn-helix domain-containing protein [unclassified Romboutsia]SCG97303.1 Transcriptional regulator containing PAS%2C AAA-type ATPase%2C and DNA-binding domains [uncultured Clostridium sp.]
MNLNDITNYIQSICENISSVLDVDVTLVTKDLIRIAGTGVFKDKIGEKISEETVYYKVLTEGKSYLINKEIDNECNKCCYKNQCKELADICTPVKLGNEILGLLGIAAFDEVQKNKFISKNEDLTEFISRMSDLISFKLDEMYKEEVKTMDDLEKEAIEKAIKKYGSNTECMKKVADALDIGIATLYRKVKKYNIK